MGKWVDRLMGWQELEAERQNKLTFKPYVSHTSTRIVEDRRRNTGTAELTAEERCCHPRTGSGAGGLGGRGLRNVWLITKLT